MSFFRRCVNSESIVLRLIMNTTVVFISGSLARLISLAGVVYLARTISVEALGKIGFAEGVCMFMILFSDLGLQTIGTREIAANRDDPRLIDKLVNSITSIQLTLVTFWFCCLLIVALIFFDDVVDSNLFIMYGFCSVYTFVPTLEWWLNGSEQLHITAMLRVVREVIFLGLILLFVTNTSDVLRIPISLGISMLFVACYICIRYMKTTGNRITFHYSTNYWKLLVKTALPVGLTGLLNQFIVRSGLIMVGILSTSTDAGIFTAAWKLFIVGFEVLSVLTSAVFPIMVRLYISDQLGFIRTRNYYRNITFIIALTIILMVIFFSQSIVDLILGTKFEDSAVVLQSLGIGLGFVFLSTSFATSLVVSQDESRLIMPSIVGTCISVILCIVLIPNYGANGAAWSYALSSICVTTLLVISYWRTDGKIQKSLSPA